MGTVKYLLDTHTYLWVALDDPKLSTAAKNAIKSKNAEIYVSPVTAYEIMNKYRLGKLPEYAYVAENYLDVFKNLGADELLISTNHLHFAGNFEWPHRDPFDRILAAQAATDNLTLITNDPIFQDLPWITVLW